MRNFSPVFFYYYFFYYFFDSVLFRLEANLVNVPEQVKGILVDPNRKAKVEQAREARAAKARAAAAMTEAVAKLRNKDPGLTTLE